MTPTSPEVGRILSGRKGCVLVGGGGGDDRRVGGGQSTGGKLSS